MTPYVVCCLIVAFNLGIAVTCYALGRKEGWRAGEASGYGKGVVVGIREGQMQPREFIEGPDECTSVVDLSEYAAQTEVGP